MISLSLLVMLLGFYFIIRNYDRKNPEWIFTAGFGRYMSMAISITIAVAWIIYLFITYLP